MTTQERQQLEQLIERLEEIQAVAPQKTSYSRGRTGSSVSYNLLMVIKDMRETFRIINEPDTEPEPTE